MHKKRRTQLAWLVAALTATSGLYMTATTAVAGSCDTTDHLVGSTFEIDKGDANLKVDDPDCIDWLSVSVAKKKDATSGSGDNAFGQGTSENDAVPTKVLGSIPPNKSDLNWFGVSTETNTTGDQFLQLFWSRVQNPKGTTNMDFELNQKGCFPDENETAGCSTNGVTPDRTSGDLLITYELSKGGTDPHISIWKWNGSKWIGPTELSNQVAVGSVNTTPIPILEADGIGANKAGGLDPFTFGEASIAFSALFPTGTCGGFGSAYLKSRSSDSFTSELKDFIAPERVDINNCPAPISTAQFFIPQDTATIGDPSPVATGKVTFSLYDDAACNPSALVYTETVDLVAAKASTHNPGGAGVPEDGFTVTAENGGTYKWVVHYDPLTDKNYAESTTDCGEEQFTLNIADHS